MVSVTTALESVDQKFADMALRHQIYVQRYATGEVNAMLDLMNKQVYPELQEITRKSLRGLKSNVTPWRQQRYLEMLKALRASTRANMAVARGSHKARLKAFAQQEAAWNATQAGNIMEASLRIAPPSVINAIATSQPFQGRHLSGWWDNLSSSLQTNYEQALNVGISLGESIPTIISRLKTGPLSRNRQHAETIIRTAANHISNAARQATADANSDIIRGVRFLATLDARTTVICAAHDQLTDPGDLGEVRPPLHLRCRSTIMFVPKKIKGVRDVPGKRAARGPSGKTELVSSKLTYDQWLRRQPEWFQRDVLGAKRFAAFKKGAPIRRFVDAGHRPMSARQLAQGRPSPRPRPRRPDMGAAAGAKSLTATQKQLFDKLEAKAKTGTLTAKQTAQLGRLRTRFDKYGVVGEIKTKTTVTKGGTALTETQKQLLDSLEAKMARGGSLTARQAAQYTRLQARFEKYGVVGGKTKSTITKLTSAQRTRYEDLMRKYEDFGLTDAQLASLNKLRTKMEMHQLPPKQVLKKPKKLGMPRSVKERNVRLDELRNKTVLTDAEKDLKVRLEKWQADFTLRKQVKPKAGGRKTEWLSDAELDELWKLEDELGFDPQNSYESLFGKPKAKVARLRSLRDRQFDTMNNNARAATPTIGTPSSGMKGDDILEEIGDMRRLYRSKEEIRQRVHELLKVSDPIDIRIAGDLHPKSRESAKWVSERVSKSVTGSGGQSNFRIRFQQKRGQRAYADHSGSTVMLAPNDSMRTVVHEIGHHVEYNSPFIAKQRQKFYELRTRGLKPRKLKDITGNKFYADREVAVEDDFIDPYIGKLYRTDGLSPTSEVISMGIDMLWRDPLNFAKKDPDMFVWICDLLKGHKP